jgi:hypothetical protein
MSLLLVITHHHALKACVSIVFSFGVVVVAHSSTRRACVYVAGWALVGGRGGRVASGWWWATSRCDLFFLQLFTLLSWLLFFVHNNDTMHYALLVLACLLASSYQQVAGYY